MQTKPVSLSARIGLAVLGAIMVLAGGWCLAGGVWLIALGGSWYFAMAGIGLIVAGVLIAIRRLSGAAVYALVLAGTVVWALAEVGLDFWPLVSRLVAPAVIAIVVLLVLPWLSGRGWRPGNAARYGLAGLLGLALVGTGVRAFTAKPLVEAMAAPVPAPLAARQGTDWQYYGRTLAGTRFAPFDQITPQNVGQLEVAWTFRTGDVPTGGPPHAGAENQNTPMQIGDTLYVCTPHNIVFALDADTGKQRWKFDPKASSPLWQRCRGVAYHKVAAAPADAAPVQCAERSLLTTIDARLIALDAKTGQLCSGFGTGGVVDLKQGMGEVKPGFYFQTSMPTVARGKVIVGGWVLDNVEVNEPSGVVRAFDAMTGALVWAWDLGNPAITGLPPAGQSYTRGTPNVWSTPAVDEALGLVYLPTGNATPDFFGGHRSKEAEAYSSSIVALDMESGKERWKFQTVHHDIWDYDVPAQPALFDMPDGRGGIVPALIQVTKRSQTFVLDRRTGQPLTPVVERAVPQGAVAGDRTAPTQPYSIGMPAIGVEPLSEAKMWGITPFDQLWCRIQFRKMRYAGDFTPPGLTPSLQWPGYYGGMNWGSATIDERRGYLIVNDTRSAHRVQLVPRAVADRAGAAASHDGLSPQTGTPYGAAKVSFLSPLGVPCQDPPYGTLTAIDLKTRKIAWQVPLGTVRDTGPAGIRMGMNIPVGMPSVGGPVSTSSGLVFFAGTLDFYLRAFDTASGRELWKGRLPVGTQTTPMTYVSPKTGRQYVIAFAGGARESPDRGDHVIAYALPQRR